jgi:hypothetical protein
MIPNYVNSAQLRQLRQADLDFTQGRLPGMGYVFVGPIAPTQEQLDAITAALGIPEDAILWAEVDVTLVLRPKAGNSLTVGSAVTLQFVNGTFTVKAGSSDTFGVIPTLSPSGDLFAVETGVSDTVGGMIVLSLSDATFVVEVGVSDTVGSIIALAADVPPSFTSQPVALRVTQGGIHLGYDTADPDGDNYDVAYRFDNTGSWTTIWTNETPGAGKVVYASCTGATGNHTIALRLTSRTGDATPAYSDSVAVDIPNVTLEVLGQTIGNTPSGWSNLHRNGSLTVEDGAPLGSLANRVIKQYYDGSDPGSGYNYDHVLLTGATYTRIEARVRRDAQAGGSSCIRFAKEATVVGAILQAEGDGHFHYDAASGGNHLLPTDTTWIADTWQDTEFRNIDLSAKTADVYIDGVSKGTIDLPPAWSGTIIDDFELVNWFGAGSGVTNTMYLDYANFWL